MIIFVEGPDGAGKTTYIEKLKHKIGKDRFGTDQFEVKHFGVPDDPTTQVGMYMDAMSYTYREVIIFDRCWYSDMVYGPVMRGESGIDISDCRLLEEFAKSKGGVFVIYVTSDIDKLWDRCQQRGEDYIQTKEQLESIRSEYEGLMSIIGLPMYKVIT